MIQTIKAECSHFFTLLYFSTGDSVQQLFGGVDPSSKMLADRYKEAPELAAYLTARASGARLTLHTDLLHIPLAWIY